MTGLGLLALLPLFAAPAASEPAGGGQAPCKRVARSAVLGLEVELPAGWCVEPLDASANGAAAAWRLTACGALEALRPPQEASGRGVLWLHTEASMLAAEERCRRETGEPYSDGCAEGWLFERGDLVRERRVFVAPTVPAAGGATGAEGVPPARWRAGDGREWLVDPPPGKSSSILPLELATHVDGTRVALVLWLQLDEGDPANDRALDAARAARWRAVESELARIRVRSF